MKNHNEIKSIHHLSFTPDRPIPYGKQHITQEDINVVIDVLKSDYLTQGPTIKKFENAFADYIGCKYAVAVSNGTAALHLCTLVLGVRPGDKVITTPITFAASANCVRYCGGNVVFADIDPETYLLDIKEVKKLLESSPEGTYKGIIPVDFAGRPVNMEEFKKLADEFNLWIIEDACHAPGGYFTDSKGQKQFCGNGQFADLAIFSFHPVKHIACGEGGMITTNDEALYKKLLVLRTHGITKDTEQFQNTMEFAAGVNKEQVNSEQLTDDSPQLTGYPGWYYEMQTIGYNYRLTDIQSALGISQLKRANEGLGRRKAIAKRYYEAFENHPRILSQSGVPDGHAYHLYVIRVENRLELYNYLKHQNIFAQVHYIPVHMLPYYRSLGWKKGNFPVAEKYYEECLSLPMYPSLSDEDQEHVIRTIFAFYES